MNTIDIQKERDRLRAERDTIVNAQVVGEHLKERAVAQEEQTNGSPGRACEAASDESLAFDLLTFRLFGIAPSLLRLSSNYIKIARRFGDDIEDGDDPRPVSERGAVTQLVVSVNEKGLLAADASFATRLVIDLHPSELVMPAPDCFGDVGQGRPAIVAARLEHADGTAHPVNDAETLAAFQLYLFEWWDEREICDGQAKHDREYLASLERAAMS
jgi:hypothetical protein